MTFGNRIANYRKEKNMTQEALANELGVTNQAVSKWENDQSYPDIEQLPNLADLFGVSIDALFGREQALAVAEQPDCGQVGDLPWKNDRTLRAVVYQGHTLLTHMEAVKDMTFTFRGEPVDVECCFNLSCGNVSGDVEAGGRVNCDKVYGDVEAGGNVNCGDVSGDVDAGCDVACGNVGGDVDAGGSVTCGNVEGDVDAGGNILRK